MVNLFIVYELGAWSRDLDMDLTLRDCVLAAVKLTKNGETDKYGYSGYGVEFDARSQFSLLISG